MDGPNGAGIKFAIGPISPEPDLETHQNNLREIASRFGHDVMGIGYIDVLGKNHATMVYDFPKPGLDQLLVCRFKNYHLIFNGTEYVVTARVATLPRGISLTRPQTLDINEFNKQRRLYGNVAERLQKIYAYEEDYDSIIRTFKLVR